MILVTQIGCDAPQKLGTQQLGQNHPPCNYEPLGYGRSQRLWEFAKRWVTTPMAQEVDVQQGEILVKWSVADWIILWQAVQVGGWTNQCDLGPGQLHGWKAL